MPSRDTRMREQTEEHGKPFPRACLTCGKEAVWPAPIDYDAKVRHEGRLYEFHVPDLRANQCRECGETTFGNVADEQITRALREHLGLLQPDQIQVRLSALGMPQEVFAERIGVAPETVSQWLSGQSVPSRAMDNLMRVFLEFEDVRMALSGAR